MLNFPQVFRLKLDSSGYSPVHRSKVCLIKQSVLSTIFPDQLKCASCHYGNVIYTSSCILYQLIDISYFFFMVNNFGIALAHRMDVNDSPGKENLFQRCTQEILKMMRTIRSRRTLT